MKKPLCLPPRKRALRAALAIALFTLAAMMPADPATIVQDNFTGTSASLPWVATGGACLTAGDSTTKITNGIGIPACGTTDYKGQTQLGGVSGTLPDPVGQGALRLTNDDNQFVQGGIIDTSAFPTDQGIQITFTTYTYDALQGGKVREYNDGTCPSGNNYICKNHGGDGILFFLLSVPKDSSGNPVAIDPSNLPVGGAGGSLGYSCNNRNSQGTSSDPTFGVDGMPAGYIGLGMDDGGFFLDKTDNTSTQFSQQIPETIGMRGSGNLNWSSLNQAYPTYYPSTLSSSQKVAAVENTCMSGYLWNYSKSSSPKQTSTPIANYGYLAAVHLPSTTPMSSVFATTRGSAFPITYRLIITPDNKLSLDYNWNNTGFTSILPATSITSSNGTLPPYFRFGFAGTAGGASNIHEITCFEASPAARTIGAPVAPLTISSNGYLYSLDSNPSPVQGYVYAYALSSNGTASSTASWEAGALMSGNSTRSSSTLESTAADGSSISTLGSLATNNAAAFALSATTCVPNVSTIVSYTVNPNTAAPSGCSLAYLGSRASGSVLDGFGTGDFATLLSPPASASDALLPGYLSYATTEKSRPTALLFTNNDGFLYSIDASTGALRWGWMPRSFVPQLQSYSTFPYSDNFAGKFAVVDAQSTAGGNTTWGTYLVGSAQGGALWYDLALDANGNPSKVITTFLPQTSPMPSNTQALPSGTTGYPQRQAPVIGSIGGSQYAAFIVNGSSGSTLVEFNVATGASTSASLPNSVGTVTSELYLDQAAGEIYFGNGSGNLYVTSFSGTAKTDIGNITSIGTTQDGQPVIYLGTQTVSNLPYLWAVSTSSTASTSTLTVFGIGSSGWSPIWASGAGTAYSWGGSGWNTLASTSTTPAPMQNNALVSDTPRVVNGVLVVPTYVPPGSSAASCNINGEGYYDFFKLPSGAFPSKTITQNGQYLTGNLDLGQGQAYTPNISVGGSTLPVYGGTQQSSSMTPLLFNGASINQIVQWRVH